MKLYDVSVTFRMPVVAKEKCGATTPLVAYHSDYSKPLDVVWLCRSCLALLQASNRRQNDGERQTDEG